MDFNVKVWGIDFDYCKIINIMKLVDYEGYIEHIDRCTGIKDKNGIEICEGDTVKMSLSRKGKVFYNKGRYQIRSITKCVMDSRNETETYIHNLWDYDEEVEIIGNIHKEDKNDN